MHWRTPWVQSMRITLNWLDIAKTLGKIIPGSVFFIEMEGENHFKYFLMALGQCIREFQNTMRPINPVDGTILKIRCKGKLIVATCQDINI